MVAAVSPRVVALQAKRKHSVGETSETRFVREQLGLGLGRGSSVSQVRSGRRTRGSRALDEPFPPVPECEEREDTEREQHQDAVEAVLLDRLRGRLAGPVGEQGDAGRPDDPACLHRVPGPSVAGPARMS